MTARVKTYLGTESREKRIAWAQSARVKLILLLTFFSVIEFTVVCMAYYAEVPMWLMSLCLVCIFFNMPLIWWLGSLWWEQHKRDKELKKQQEMWLRGQG